MSEGKKPGFFDRLFGRPQPQPKPAEPEAERQLPPDLVPASEVLPVEPEPAKPEEVASEIESERAEGLTPEGQHLREQAPPPPGPPETTTDYAEAVDDHLAAPPAPVTPVPPPPAPPAARRSWLQRLTGGLKRSSDQLTGGITAVFTKRRLDGAMLDELEDLLLTADFGIETTSAITDTLRRDRFDKDVTTAEVRSILAAEVEKVLAPVAQPLAIDATKKPFVILMVGVNGSGKTTTIGKLAQKLAAEGKSVMLAAGDTFRAAAIEQLQIWGQRTGAPVIARPAGSDASGLAFDAVSRAKQEGRDVLIIDTAGRLQNRDELMSELEKIIRVIKKLDDSAPHAVLLTLDATTGQNALNQVEIFGKRAGVTGLVMTKLDGTARGGILVAIARRFGLPVHFIGVGEGVDDLEAFTARDFASAIAGRE
jgi:fused signal recognition particle receptor